MNGEKYFRNPNRVRLSLLRSVVQGLYCLLPPVAGGSNYASSCISCVFSGGGDRPLPRLYATLVLRHAGEEVRALHLRRLRRQPQQFRLGGVLHGRVQTPE